VEDDLVIALMIEELVREFGYAVSRVASTVAMARLQIAQHNFDAVLLDINMEGEYQPETADVLLEAAVPFAFVTGYDYVLEPRHEGVPLLEKPFGLFNSASCWRSWSGRDHRPGIASRMAS
jgi:CheY-like chemotaxis protein